MFTMATTNEYSFLPSEFNEDGKLLLWTNAGSFRCQQDCTVRPTSLLKFLNHLRNGDHYAEIDCYCKTTVSSESGGNLGFHMDKCMFLGTFGCSLCSCKFKDLISANNHAWSAHGHNGQRRFTFELVASVTFFRPYHIEWVHDLMMKKNDDGSYSFKKDCPSSTLDPEIFEAQVHKRKNTKWDHMQWGQIEERARNNSLKRTIIRDLLMESDFSAKGSKIFRLAQLSRGRLPAFKKTLGNRRYFSVKVNCADGMIEILLNPADREFNALYNQVADYQVLEAQALFVPDQMTHKVDFGAHMTDIVRSVSACLERVGASVTLTQHIISFLCKLTVSVRSSFDPIVIGAMLLDTLVTGGISYDLAAKVMEKIKDRIASAFTLISNQFVSQVADFDPWASLATIVAMIGGTLLMQKVPSDGQMSSLMKGVCQLGNVARGATFAWTALEKLIKFVCDKIFEWQTGFPVAITEVETLIAGTQVWYKKVQSLISQSTAEEIARDPRKILEIQSLVRQGLAMKAQLQGYNVEARLMTAFDLHFRMLQLYFFQAQSSGAFRGGPRIEPINIYIYGTSGQGKTGLINFLAIDLLKIDGMPTRDGKADYTEELYYRAIEQEFWDGYCGQRIVVYDDFGQLIDSQANPNLEYMEFIRTGNMAPMPLHMAHLADKAKSFFTSRVVIATSNNDLASVKIPSLSAPMAFKRRVDICVELYNDPRYCKKVEETRGSDVWRLDSKKVERITGKPFSTESYRFRLRDVNTGDQIGNEMNYDQFRSKCVRVYEERARSSANLTQVLADHAREEFRVQIAQDLRDKLSTNGAEISLNPNCCEVFEKFTLNQIDTFLRQGHEEMRDMFLTEVNDMFDEMKGLQEFHTISALDALDQAELMTIWKEQIQQMGHSYGHWMVADAVEIMRGKFQRTTYAGIGHLFRCLPMPDQYNHLHLFIDNIRIPMTENRVVAQILERADVDSRPLWRKWLDAGKDLILKHPWYTAIVAVLALIGVKFWWDMRSSNLEVSFNSTPPLDYHHKGLKLGERVQHAHECEICTKVFLHTHTIRSYHESLKYEHMCDKCRVWVSLEVYDRADEVLKRDAKEAIRLALGWQDISVPVSEGSSSGDAKTNKKGQSRTQLGSSGDAKTTKKGQTRSQLDEDDQIDEMLAQFDMREMDTHLQSDPNSLQLSKKILNNMYNIDLKIEGEWLFMLKLMMIRGRVGLTAGHLAPYLARASEIRIWNATKPDGHVFSTAKLQSTAITNAAGEKKDQMLIAFPPGLHDHFDLIKHMATEVEFSSFTRARACIVVPFEHGAILRTGPVEKKTDNPRKYFDKDGAFEIVDRFEYSGMETAPGDCGSPLVAIGTSLARKLIGIHVCGKHAIGVASPLNEADVLRALEQFDFTVQIAMSADDIMTEFQAPWEVILPKGNFTAAGRALYSVPMPTKTALLPSLISGSLQEPTTAPSVLSWEAMEKGLEKAGNIPPELDDDILDIVINDVSQLISAGPRRLDRVLSEDEAVRGVEGDEFAQPINRRTSPGYPYSGLKKTKPGKEAWLGSGENYQLDDELRQRMRKRIEMARNGERMPAPFIDTLKDERRPLDKIAAKKTRVFSAGAMDYTLVFRMYFLAFASHVMHNRIDNEISVGTNVYSYDWTRTAKRVLSKGHKVIAGDFSNFDGTLLLPMLYRILDIINAFYDDGNDRIRHVLWKEIINSIHIKGNSVYLWTHSQPSGCPITAILNSLYNSVSMRYVWMTVVPPRLRMMRHFNHHVAMVSYGDDNLVNISDEVIDVFNQLTIAEGYEKIGMKYTDESKSGNMVAYRTLQECAYLKRGFLWDEEEMQWLAPLDFGTILEMTNWIRKDLDPEAATISNLETSHFELHLHGKEFFETWSPRYWNACKHLEQKPRLPTYIELRYDEERKQGRFY